MSVLVDLNAVGFVAVQSAVTAEWIRTGAIHRVRRAVLGERAGTVRVMLVTGMLSMLITNDAALIIVLSLLAPGASRPHRVVLPFFCTRGPTVSGSSRAPGRLRTSWT
ncbi:hypothetical protein [Methanopyrus sp. KOL6]|uniref:hypothetical protein n=1 Tax=Methanopyrus sp. KOL6 TaxID=1937004 RepID=UPI000B4AB132|nr:hypothetical protein [Methanopyrus sp. KOL6]